MKIFLQENMQFIFIKCGTLNKGQFIYKFKAIQDTRCLLNFGGNKGATKAHVPGKNIKFLEISDGHLPGKKILYML